MEPIDTFNPTDKYFLILQIHDIVGDFVENKAQMQKNPC
jgi:hypothetical protein